VQGDGIDTFRDNMPDNPDMAIALLEYGGTQIARHNISIRNIQFQVRSKKYEDSRLKAIEIHKYLVEQPDSVFVLPNAKVFTGEPLQFPYKLKVDSTSRTTFAFNFTLTIQND
jgi:hypothetical protein